MVVKPKLYGVAMASTGMMNVWERAVVRSHFKIRNFFKLNANTELAAA